MRRTIDFGDWQRSPYGEEHRWFSVLLISNADFGIRVLKTTERSEVFLVCMPGARGQLILFRISSSTVRFYPALTVELLYTRWMTFKLGGKRGIHHTYLCLIVHGLIPQMPFSHISRLTAHSSRGRSTMRIAMSSASSTSMPKRCLCSTCPRAPRLSGNS